ncbi:hypothetical protein N9B17_02475 [Rhodopirellula sp.]|nr:hypothetical protein [Rhodopirellula sp.]MDA7907123.1 hypothetical protein [bacterium]MDB4419423.1 hypothetical protein [bacterium]
MSSKFGLQPVLVFATVGCVAGTLGGWVVRRLHAGFGIDQRKTNLVAIFGALLGALAGGYLGVVSGFGTWMIATFNPGLPEMDFRDSFGAIGGVFIGSILGASAMAGLVVLMKRRCPYKPANESGVVD